MNLRFGTTHGAGLPAFGPKDLAILTRVRAMALVLRAASPPELEDSALGLTIDRDDQLSCLHTGWTGCLFLARRAGWRDLLEVPDTFQGHCVAGVLIKDRLARAEFPQPCPIALGRVLRQVRTHTTLPAHMLAALRQAGWEPCFQEFLAQPIVPERPSAHELLEALAGVEAVGGWGDGPLGRLARSAALERIGGRA